MFRVLGIYNFDPQQEEFSIFKWLLRPRSVSFVWLWKFGGLDTFHGLYLDIKSLVNYEIETMING